MRDVVQLTTEVPVRPAAPAPDLPHRSPDVGFWAVFVAVLAIGSAAAFIMYRLDNSSLVYFGDTASHLFLSRKMADWAEDPGLGRFGTVWLPLPHLLFLPFTLVGPMFSTGFAGFAVSLPSLALSAAFLYKIIRTHLAASAFVAGAGALLYVLNPNTLYLGLIAMTEAPFMLFFVGSAYFLQKWYRQSNDLRALMWSSTLAALATLCRYEGWILPLFLCSVVALLVVRGDLPGRRKVAALLLTFLSFAGCVLWAVYNALEFATR